MSTLTKVKPTKVELIKLRRRLVISIRVHKILTERLVVLVNEYMARLREALELRKRVQEAFRVTYRRAIVLLGLYGSSLQEYLAEVSTKPKIYIGTENIMGVKVKSVIVKYPEEPYPWGLEDFTRQSRFFAEIVLDLARAEHALREIGKEIATTKRKANALKYIVIPRLRSTMKMLQLKFDEREREEKSRLKRIKQLHERRSSFE